VIRNVVYMANHVYVPASFAALACGLVMVSLGGGWTEVWIVLGLVGFAATAGTDAGILKPRADRIVSLMAREGNSEEAERQGREMLRIAQFDMVMLGIVVADMVLKPSLDNYVTLLVMAVVLAAGAAYFLGPLRSAQPVRA
jgi:hypothetical protein